MPAFPGTGRSTLGGQRTGLPVAACGRTPAVRPGKKTAEAIQQEITREVSQLLRVILNGRRPAGHLELEATEMLVRSAMHHAGQLALGRGPARDHARSKPTVACDSQRPPPSGTSGTGGHRDVGALRHAPCWIA